MRPWADFHGDVIPYVIGCPVPSADHALRRSAQEFFERTRVWRVNLDPVITSTETEYDIELEPQSELVRIERGTIADRPLNVLNADSLPANFRSQPDCHRDSVFTTDRKVLQLANTPAIGEALKLEVSLKPSNTASGIQDFLFDQYVQVIAWGALSKLMLQPNADYVNPKLAMVNRQMFEEAMVNVNVANWRGFSSSRPRAKASFF